MPFPFKYWTNGEDFDKAVAIFAEFFPSSNDIHLSDTIKYYRVSQFLDEINNGSIPYEAILDAARLRWDVSYWFGNVESTIQKELFYERFECFITVNKLT